jgi:hypothetical protein
MSPRDWFEIAWHASLLLLVAPQALSFLLRHAGARLGLGLIVLGALAYHVVIVQACHQSLPLCYWSP